MLFAGLSTCTRFMAYQDTGKHVVAFMILALVLSFAALIALWAMGAIPTTSYPQILQKHESPVRQAITADVNRPGFVRERCLLRLAQLSRKSRHTAA